MSKAIPLGRELIENPHDIHDIPSCTDYFHRMRRISYEPYGEKYQDLKLGNSVLKASGE